MYRLRGRELEVFLAHPGGPFFARKDAGHWTIPKGEVEAGEDLLATAVREFEEEIGIKPHGDFLDIGCIKQKGGKLVHAWAFAGDWPSAQKLKSNTYRMEWPPYSGTFENFPEVDRAEFFSLVQARAIIKETQLPFIDRLEAALGLETPTEN